MSEFRRRTLTRLAAVQALFQMNTGLDLPSVTTKNFLVDANRLQDNALKGLDKNFLSELVLKTQEQISTLDPIIKNHLTSSWKFDRLDPVIISILRLASFELLHFNNLPSSIIINEYLDITYSFYNTKEETKFINGILNSIAKTIRD